MREILKSDWIQWKANPVTKALAEAYFERREWIKEQIAQGIKDETYLGQCMALKDAIDYIISDFEVIDEEKKDGD